MCASISAGRDGIAYITDSSPKGSNGLIVVDLDTGESRRRLHEHPSTRPDPQFLPIVEGQALLNRPPGGKPAHLPVGSDGIALSHDGRYLYWCALASRRLYRIRTEILIDDKAADEEIAKAVEDLGDRGFASDGLEADAQGRLYLSNYEDNAILRRDAAGNFETLVHDPRVLWPDTLSLAHDGHLYFIANQLHRQPNFHQGEDGRDRVLRS